METIVFSTDDIRLIVQHVWIDALMDEMIERLIEAFVAYDQDETIIPARAGFQYDRDFARQLNLGTMIRIESVSSDSRNPYQFVMEKNYSIPVSEFALRKNLEA